MSNETIRPRSEIEPKYLWNAESVFANSAAWQQELADVSSTMAALAAFAGTLGNGPARLADFLELSGKLSLRVGKLHFYATMSSAVDTSDPSALSMVGQADALFGRFQAAVSFLDPELLALGQATVDRWVTSESRLHEYVHYVEDLFRKQAHVRSAEVEEVLGLVEEVFASADNTHRMLVDADLKFTSVRDAAGQEIAIAQSTIEKHLSSPDRELRQQAWYSFCDAHNGFGNTLTAALGTAVRKDVFAARVRGFPTSLEAALFSGNIPASVFHSTIETFKQNLPVWHRYWRARRKALKLPRLQHWDIWAPIATKQPVVPYEQAVDWIAGALAPLGKQYTADLRQGCLQDRWVDVYPTIGKGSGAFSYGYKGTHPFIMMSYSDDLSSMSTLAHELGHSMHSLHTWRKQPDIYADYSIFVAEVASNFNQAMTRAYLFEREKDPQFQIALIEEAMENFHRYFFIMPTLARFELEFHRRVEAGEGVSASDLNTLMCDLFAEGYGSEMEIDREREGSTWAQFSHLYMNYYVFQYATGISAAHALAAPILNGDQAAAARYIDFLSCGSSRYPVDALRLAGVDMSTPNAMQQAFQVLEGLISRLEALTG